uniref:Glucosamine/galactosamine-6-phosphate isomerase domain-containing protein n=1 Tax=Cajanus cajan TaxID=3821 RepID=A0A151SL82_CAJCA|nr:hypothetical protein KK1_001774 [Cajanus cajan]
MAFSVAFSTSYCTLQSSILCAQKSNPQSLKTSSLFPPGKKLFHQPLRYKDFSPKRGAGEIKASIKWEKGYKKVEVFSKEHLAVSLAYDVAQLSNKFTRERGAFTVVLSGGSLIKYLRKLVRTSLYRFHRVPIPRVNIYAIDDALPADGAADVYETTLKRLMKSNVGRASSSLGKYQ